MGQNRRLVMTSLMPRHRAALPAEPGRESCRRSGQPFWLGRSRTTTHTATAMNRVSTPTRIKVQRQPIMVLIWARGELATRAPTPPMAMNMPPTMTNLRGSNHSANSLKLETNTVETPSPTSTRPTMAQDRSEVSPISMEPPAARIKEAVTVRRGPQESARSPTGSCIRP